MARLIDAEAVREKAHKLPNGYNWGWFHKCVDEMIDTAPTIDPVKHGKWKEVWNGSRFGYECTICGQPRSGVSEWNYCPSCGAMMDSEENDDDNDAL